MICLANEAEARHLMRFFKTAPGEYGEGDLFLGIRVPKTREIVRRYKNDVTIDDVSQLVASLYHEIRLAGFLLLIEIYDRSKRLKDDDGQRRIIDFYLSILDRGNNWDLVDLVAYKLLGDWLIDKPSEKKMLYHLSDMNDRLWHQRVAIVSTLALMRAGQYHDTMQLAEKYLTHKHDLIHKATGWMLREMGKRGGRSELVEFLERHAKAMPRTMLRYAIEHFSVDERQHFMKL